MSNSKIYRQTSSGGGGTIAQETAATRKMVGRQAFEDAQFEKVQD